ncbi:MAG: FAD-binding and (Fe-S)-binding domain-containing protein, partial [Thermoguttaceae bacterium]
SLHARGAGTAVAGGALGSGLVIDFSKYLRHLIRVDSTQARLQPGMVLERLDLQLSRQGRIFGPASAKPEVTTIGGLIALDAAGSRWLKYGSVRDHVVSLQTVLADGEILELGREPLIDGVSPSTIPRKRELVNRLAALFKQYAEVIAAHRPKSSISRCGYNLDGVLGPDFLDVARLLVGSEGTLAFITEARINTDPPPGCRGATLFLFDSVDKAARAAREILAWKPNACELMDRRHLSLAREAEVQFDLLIPAETEALLLVELEATELIQLHDQSRKMEADIIDSKRLAFAMRQGFEPDEFELFWRLVENSQSIFHRLKGSARFHPLASDLCVDPENLPEFIPRVQNILKRQQVTASLFAHAGQGQLQVHPFLDFSSADELDRFQRFSEELYHDVLDFGGSITAEHGYGLSRSAFLKQQAGPLYEVLREIKSIFDPKNLLNPGKILGDAPDQMISNLLPSISLPAADAHTEKAAEAESPPMRDLVELQMDWDPGKVVNAVMDCNRCGTCRTQSPRLRMCPIFRIAPSEEASPRAKANLLRAVLCGALELEQLTSDEFKGVADLCLHCHACRLECPTNVDIPHLMRQAKGAYTATNSLSFSQWAMIHLDLLGSLGGLISPVAN